MPHKVKPTLVRKMITPTERILGDGGNDPLILGIQIAFALTQFLQGPKSDGLALGPALAILLLFPDLDPIPGKIPEGKPRQTSLLFTLEACRPFASLGAFRAKSIDNGIEFELPRLFITNPLSQKDIAQRLLESFGLLLSLL